MVTCGTCGNLIASAGICCFKCSAQFHNSCIEGGDTGGAGAKNILCPDCKISRSLEPSEDGITSAEPEPSNTSQAAAPTDYCSLERELTCVLFPGIVKNDEKAIQCLGGIKGISQVYCQPQKKRLGLSFQPDNPFVKRVFADCKKTAGVLLKIKVKKVKINNEVQRKVISTDVVGRVNRIYRFESMCDFQYLPVYREASGEPLQCLIDKIIPSGHVDINFLKEEAPLHIVPSNFTRSDRPISYAYTDKRYPDQSANPSGEEEYHNRSRSERGMPLGHWWNFTLTDDFPSEPNECYIKTRNTKYEYNPVLKTEFVTVVKCFEERPIWTLNMIRYQTKLRLGSLKVLVPCVAVFMRDGPWRSLWVRYGFDPRKEPSARMYQTLDFRLRHTAGVHQMVMTRDQIVHYKSADRVRQMKRKNLTAPPPSEEMVEGAVLFRPGMMPSQRQIFYQLCDVKLPEVESILAEEPPPERVCHEKYGWLPPNAVDKCRDYIFKYVKQTALATNNSDLRFDDEEGASSDDDYRNSGDDITDDMDESIQ